MPQMV